MDALPQVYHHENRVDSCPFFFVFAQKTKKEQWKKKMNKGVGERKKQSKKKHSSNMLITGR